MHARALVVLGLLVLVVGLTAEISEASLVVEDLGVLAIVGALTLLAAILPSLWTGADREDRSDARARR